LVFLWNEKRFLGIFIFAFVSCGLFSLIFYFIYQFGQYR